MPTNNIKENIARLRGEIPTGVQLVVVSKFQPQSSILEAYMAGCRIFAESRPQELAAKFEELPRDIEWHFIGHLQSNKVKMIIKQVSLIHSIDTLRIAQVVSQAALAVGRVVDVLLQVHIAQEETKQGFSESEIDELLGAPQKESLNISQTTPRDPVSESLSSKKSDSFNQISTLAGIRVVGLMGMATYTEDRAQIATEFSRLAALAARHQMATVSMGMSQDYPIAIDCGSTMVRVGSLIFGDRK